MFVFPNSCNSIYMLFSEKNLFPSYECYTVEATIQKSLSKFCPYYIALTICGLKTRLIWFPFLWVSLPENIMVTLC